MNVGRVKRLWSCCYQTLRLHPFANPGMLLAGPYLHQPVQADGGTIFVVVSLAGNHIRDTKSISTYCHICSIIVDSQQTKQRHHTRDMTRYPFAFSALLSTTPSTRSSFAMPLRWLELFCFAFRLDCYTTKQCLILQLICPFHSIYHSQWCMSTMFRVSVSDGSSIPMIERAQTHLIHITPVSSASRWQAQLHENMNDDSKMQKRDKIF